MTRPVPDYPILPRMAQVGSPHRGVTSMSTSMALAICYYIRRVVPRGPQEEQELWQIIEHLERLIDGAADG